MILQSRRESAMISAIMATAKKAKSGIKRKPASAHAKESGGEVSRVLAGRMPARKPAARSAGRAQAYRRVGRHGGRLYCDPLGKNALLMAILPIDSVEPTPFQRDLSQTHHAARRRHRRTGLFPRSGDRSHRAGRGILDAERPPPARSDAPARRAADRRARRAQAEIAWQILALNTEKAHNLRDKSLEVIRIYRGLLFEDARRARDRLYVLPRRSVAGHARRLLREERKFAGGAYNPIVRRLEEFSDAILFPRRLKCTRSTPIC